MSKIEIRFRIGIISFYCAGITGEDIFETRRLHHPEKKENNHKKDKAEDIGIQDALVFKLFAVAADGKKVIKSKAGFYNPKKPANVFFIAKQAQSAGGDDKISDN